MTGTRTRRVLGVGMLAIGASVLQPSLGWGQVKKSGPAPVQAPNKS
jgi:hypothetical protein